MSNAPEIPITLSPYWLRLYGHWIHLEGIRPENDVTPNRASSDLTTVDGYRYAQQAPRGPRTWNLPYEHSTAAATAALESAANNYHFSDPTTQVLLLDTNTAKINMAPPDLLTRWRNPNATSGPEVYNVGESEGLPIWLPSYDGDGITTTRTIKIPVRAGVTYTATVWTTVGTGTVAIAVTGAAVASANGLTGSTLTNPHQATVTFTPVADGMITVAVAMGFTAGLMVYEGDCAPTSYRAGRRTPCEVTVLDPSMSGNLAWPKECDLCAFPREHSTFTLLEVGETAGVVRAS